jgi:hypothetical protein
MSEEDAEKFAYYIHQLAKRRRLDWSKVRSLEDLLCVISALFGDATVEPDSAAARKLERFLEPRPLDGMTNDPPSLGSFGEAGE